MISLASHLSKLMAEAKSLEVRASAKGDSNLSTYYHGMRVAFLMCLEMKTTPSVFLIGVEV